MYLPGWERPAFHHNGEPYVQSGADWRLVLHTTEGLGGIEGQASFMDGTGEYPHCIADPIAMRKAQIVDLDQAVTALENRPGGVETNRLNCIQVEIVWFAGRINELSRERLDWLGREVVAPICQAKNIKPVPPPRPFVGPGHGLIASVDAPQRLSFPEWVNFNGVCGHQHVPENEHWDPGELNIDEVLTAARGALELPGPNPYNPQEIDMGGMTVPSPFPGTPKGRTACGTLIPALRIVLLRNGARMVGDRATNDRSKRVWIVPGNKAIPVTDIMPRRDGKGVTVVDAADDTFDGYWSKG